MPIYTSSQRKSFIPDAYKKVSSLQKFYKTTPYYERRKSSPYIQVKNVNENKLEFASDSLLQKRKSKISLSKVKRMKCFIRRYSKSTRLSSSKSNNELEKPKQLSDRFSQLRHFWSKERSKPKPEPTIPRRQSERKHVSNTPTSKPTRFTFSHRHTSFKHGSNITNLSNEDNLVMICQLLLIRTITPERKEISDLSEQFDMKIDENFFEYYPYMFKYLYEREEAIKFNKNYLALNGFEENFRSTLMDWLIKVQLYSKMTTETLQVGVVLIDMFTSIALIKKSFYQLVGIAGMLIACKIVQRFHPRIKEFCYLTEDCYKPGHVVQMERIMLEKLNFFVNVPIPNHFCHRGLLACVEIIDTNLMEVFCNFMFDLIILHPASPGIRSSCKSAAAIFMGRFIFYTEYPSWSKILQHYTLYSVAQLKECVLIYMEMLINIFISTKYTFKAVKEKYSLNVKKSIAKNEKLLNFIADLNSKQRIINYFEK